MPLYRLRQTQPQFGPGAYAAPSADLIGDVQLGARASVWFGAVLRGDNTPLILGEETNFQDGAVGHSDADFPLTIGARVTVGHQAILHGCTIADDCLIGMGARILNGAVIETECIVGAGALVTEARGSSEAASSWGLRRAWYGRSPMRSGGYSEIGRALCRKGEALFGRAADHFRSDGPRLRSPQTSMN